ncbi:MAG TPA: stage V sporulation protein AC [Candidatus Faecisoma merdavium]|nr:stage V sporulation protein AC [Candidatus Faecisoma merdavium]
MEKNKYKMLVSKHTPRENVLKNALIAFIVGGFMGLIGQFLVDFYSYIFNISTSDGATLMIITLVFLGCLLTCLGFFDKIVHFARCGLIIPITGFAHAVMSATLEYRKEGFVTGIGANMFKLAGSVIVFGVVSAYLFGFLRLIIGG